MSSDPINEEFAENLQGYLRNTERANSEAALGHHFLTFIQNTFSTLDSGRADQLLPFLEEHVSTDSDATIAINGRIDARLGNVIIEFKTDLDTDLGQAKQQLRDYISAIWENQGREHNYYLVASDGVLCKVYAATLDGDTVHPDNVTLEAVDEISLESDDTDWVYTQLDRYLLYSEDIDPTAETIVRDFGPDSPVHRECMELLEENWEETSETGASVLFDEWKSYLEIVHGTAESQSEALFLRHTYLSTLAKLMAYIQYSGGHLPNQNQVRPAITGELFKNRGIQNFIEEDFFT